MEIPTSIVGFQKRGGHPVKGNMALNYRRQNVSAPRLLEFDTSDSLLAMVATGVGVAITTPLCLLHGVAHISGMDALPLPRPGFSRELVLVTRRGEFQSLGPRIAELARNLMRSKALPQFVRLFPLLETATHKMILSPQNDPDENSNPAIEA
jgi:DNA-binding transcriptional LysR family regulator